MESCKGFFVAQVSDEILYAWKFYYIKSVPWPLWSAFASHEYPMPFLKTEILYSGTPQDVRNKDEFSLYLNKAAAVWPSCWTGGFFQM